MTLGEFTQRLGRADFLDGLGIYVGPHELSLAHVTKRFFQVKVAHTGAYPLPGTERAVERRQALGQAVAAFAREHRIDTRRAYLCLPRSEAALSRVVLPAAARENLAQVLEYEIEHLIPLPRDQVYFDFSTRDLGEERIEVLVLAVPREVVRGYLEALEDAFVRPRGIVLASTAIADYLAFCRGGTTGALGLFLRHGKDVELALLSGGRLLASQLLPPGRAEAPAALSRLLSRQLGEAMLSPDDVPLYHWEVANGSEPSTALLGEGDLFTLAEGKLEAPADFFVSREATLLPAVGAALDAVREGSVPVNLLPAEGRRYEEGLSLATVILVALTGVLLIVWGGSALVKDWMLLREMREQLAAVQPQVHEVKQIQDEIAGLQHQVDVLTNGDAEHVTMLLKELTDLIPADAYLTSLNIRNGRATIDGQANAASGLITALEKSKHFKNVTFTSPTTRTGDKERFSIVAEVEQ